MARKLKGKASLSEEVKVEVENYKSSYIVHIMQNSTVANLIDVNNRAWKQELIVNTFSEVDAARILHIPLAKKAHNDLFV
ncbi:hypothetical protein Godav_014804 [Gossypium davidsonii]|uniref:Uncharacterized protein n=2 Tax=Gossypium TaxID=3633 RepID=A0A7J8RLQ9_GOSDV|nr:hypothetical protein [Gossypium davidsonii]MBA0649762.1 hypothetical protein [Gossypium klotzschianum]